MKRALRRNPPVLKQFATLWTLNQQPLGGKPWSLEEKVRRIKQAGFDGVSSWNTPEIVALCQKYGLECCLSFDASGKTYRERLEAACAYRPARVNIQLCDHDTPPREAAAVWIKLEVAAKKMGLENVIDLEVHRDTCTETPEKVFEIADLYRKATGKKLRFSWDFSHFAVVKHLNPPYADRLLAMRPDLIRLGRQFHFRPFNGHHCQVPVTDGRGKDAPELKPYLEFLDALLAFWLKGAKGGDVMHACPELGPVSSGYGLGIFPDVWEDAVRLRAKTEALWKKNLRNWRG